MGEVVRDAAARRSDVVGIGRRVAGGKSKGELCRHSERRCHPSSHGTVPMRTETKQGKQHVAVDGGV